ncbi:MAG: peptidoglycan-binding domain-containing protein [Microbacteriaceae bacterium]
MQASKRKFPATAVALTLLAVIAVASTVLAVNGVLSGLDRPETKPSAITAGVRIGSLEDIVEAQVQFEPAYRIEVVAPSIASDSIKVVTRNGAATGAPIKLGQRIIEVSGRPVLAVSGKVPFWRTLQFGSSGVDVEQVQAFARSLGHRISDPKGLMGRSTLRAIRTIYADRGYAMVDSSLMPQPGTADAQTLSIPIGELVSLPSLPAKIETACAPTGSSGEGKLCTLASTTGAAILVLPKYDATRVAEKAAVRLQLGDGSEVVGTVGAVLPSELPPLGDDSEDQTTQGESSVRFSIVFDADQKLEGIESATKAVIVLATALADSLIVPASAIRARGGESFWVEVVNADAEITVPVDVGVCYLGECAVVADNSMLSSTSKILLSTVGR